MLDMQSADRILTRTVSFPSGGKVLNGKLYAPQTGPVAALVINGATGVPHGYYRRFAEWVARGRNIACLTYDYSDFGESAQRHVRRSDAKISDWALIDQPAARAEMRRLLPDVPIWVLGHSLGGMMMPLQDGIEDVRRMICVASGLVHVADHPWPYQALARLFWFGHVPRVVRALGYLPGRVLGLGSDLPAQVYWEWRDWCTTRTSFYKEMGGVYPKPDWGRSGAPVDVFSFSDDDLMPFVSAKKLAGLYGVKRVQHHHVRPEDHGSRKIGHVSVFKRENSAIWPRLIDQGPICQVL